MSQPSLAALNETQSATQEGVSLAMAFLGVPCFPVSWAGRTRLVSAAAGPRSRYASVKWTPAYRWSARLVRELSAVRAALHKPDPVTLDGGLDNWPPESVRHLRPFDAIVGTPGPTQSVLVRFADPESGKPRAVVKVMVSLTLDAAERIAAESKAIQDPALEGLVPLHRETGVAAGHHYLVTEFVTGQSIAAGRQGMRVALDALTFQANAKESADARDHPWVQRALKRVPWLRPDRLSGRFPIGRMHGDFAPWNILVRRRNLTLIDWEFSEPDGVAGVDLAHYVLITQRLLKRRNPMNAARIGATELHRAVGYEIDEAHTLMALAAASVLIRKSGVVSESDGPFWKHVIEHCQE
jgi:hypothetical protein